MRSSHLLLDAYYVEELSFSVDPKYKYDGEGETKLLPSDLNVEVEPRQHSQNPLKWYCKLGVTLEDTGGRLPYMFTIKLSGYFMVSEDCPADLADRIAVINAPSLLYSAARELLAVTTGRARYLSMTLPSVTFFEPHAAKTEPPIETGKEISGADDRKVLPQKAARKRASKKRVKATDS